MSLTERRYKSAVKAVLRCRLCSAKSAAQLPLSCCSPAVTPATSASCFSDEAVAAAFRPLRLLQPPVGCSSHSPLFVCSTVRQLAVLNMTAVAAASHTAATAASAVTACSCNALAARMLLQTQALLQPQLAASLLKAVAAAFRISAVCSYP
jgi:hypothetical protein